MQASADRPRFRQDLVAEPIEDGGSKFIDVMDPDSGTLFRFYEVEYSLACAMDGQRDVNGICRWAEEELGLKASAKEVGIVIATLGDLGYLDRGAGIEAPAAAASAVAAASKPATKPATPPAKPTGRTPPAGTPVAKSVTPGGGIRKQPEQPVLNRWDAPTAMGEADEYLAQGVVAGGGRAPAPSGANVELGAPGARGVEVSQDLPRAPELELGAPGTAAKRGVQAKGPDIALGASGRADVSVDLADHVDIGAADVKEAVRASQVMKAVDVPPELAAELESKPAKAAEKPAAKAAEKPAAKAAEKPAAKQAEKPAAKQAEKPVAKPVEKRPSVTPTAPRQGVSPVLLAALIIAILAAGGFAVYKFVLKKNPTTETSTTTPPPPIKKVEPPPPPPAETQKLATEQPAPEELKSSGAQQVAWLITTEGVVKAGDPVAKYVGFKSFETDVKTVTAAVEKAKTDAAAAEKERATAEAAGNKVGVTNAEKKLAAAQKAQADNEKKLADKQGALDKYLLKAPAPGKVITVAKLNAKVTPTDVVATLQRDAILVATFKKADGATDNAPVLLAVKGSGQKLPCTVVMASGDGTKIACPAGAAPEGSEVTYAGVDANRPAGGETPPTPPSTPPGTDTGSAGSAAPPAGSGADTGSASGGEADKGSAAKADKPAAPKAPRPVHRPRPPQPAGGDKPAGGSASGDKPAGGDTTPAPTPTPAPAGSNSL